MKLTKTLIASVVCFGFASSATMAKVPAEDVAKLGTSLTPMGSEMSANADGSIPAWDGGIKELPSGFKSGDFHPDPYADEKPLFTITASNAQEYKDKLTPGQLALFAAYPQTFKMNIYPTHRSASYPEHVYEATRANAARSELVEGGNGLKQAAVGFPFPIPQNGLEVIWNHIVRYRGETVTRDTGQAAPQRDGSYTMVKFRDELDQLYNKKGTKPEDLEKNNMLFYFKQWVISPARLAGTALLVHETLDQIKKPRQAWTYNTGQRRVRRAPNVAYDAPGTAADGLRTTDDFDMYNGAPNRYDWKLIGKKEMYIPYNTYKLHSNSVTYDEIIQAGHINQDLVRYELHRVWVVEANLKSDTRHQYKKRVFYIDEDSWQIAVTDIYDTQDELWRVGFAHAINYYDVPTLWSTLEVFHDLKSGRYLAIGLDNEDAMYDFNAKRTKKDFTPAALRRAGRR
ncbi:DUF1329 domain-containing protein [Aliikangiella coralliicola]|uniref:DUF1329 domain-containing protein n=1 Tax=Aliikangiella coralliicola TaxID=2592383 RepID=A0A545TWF8_9GAMM|nr:DUF1329 domain-containing protein [Aliikangiella coralliicola]TQV81511.1 DUF1329 domain-containing protein [Aliikangiella coralliicola]